MHAIHTIYRAKQQAIHQRLRDFTRVHGDDIFYELCFCILTPGSNANHCAAAVNHLRTRDFLHTAINPTPYLHGVRFHNHKTRYLLRAKTRYPKFLDARRTLANPRDLRAWLVTTIDGLGMKESSHFLRNIGYRGLAILDRHILAHLARHRVIPARPRTLTRRRYLDIERRFHRFATRIGIPIDELDLLFWSEETGHIFK